MFKKCFILGLIIVLCNNSYSQNHVSVTEWKSSHIEADELTGAKSGTLYYAIFENKNYNCSIHYNSNSKDKIKITLFNAIFEVEPHYSGGYWIEVLIGFYENDKLVKKVDTGFWANDDMKSIWVMDPILNKKIRKYLEDNNLPTNRYIRFVTDLYDNPNLDIKVYPRIINNNR